MCVKKSIAVVISMVLFCLIMPIGNGLENTVSAETKIWDGTADTSWYDSQEVELHISTAEELAGLATLVNAGRTMSWQTIYLDNDIYLNDVSDFENWGTEPPKNEWISISTISGTLDGNGHTVYGMYLQKNESLIYGGSEKIYVGFCNTCSGTIQNLNLNTAYISTTQTGWNSRSKIDTMFCIGGISGLCTEYGSIKNCVASGSIQTTSTSSTNHYNGTSTVYFNTAIGGIAGKSEGIISQCANNMNIHGQSSNYAICKGRMFAGGICGSGAGSIFECRNSGTISCNSYTAGICGFIGKNCALYDCYNEGQLGGDITGGIVGYVYPSTTDDVSILRVYNVGAESSENYLTGGVIGWLNGTCSRGNAYYLNTTSLTGVANLSGTDMGGTISKSASNMQKESFAESLGEAFVYNEGGYPLLAWEVETQQETLAGDINLDGIFDVADVKLLQDYLLCRETLTAEQGAVADVCNDGVLDVFDLCVLKRMYVEKSKTA